MKHWLVYTISSLLLFSCGKKHYDGAISISLEKRDSLLIEYITKEFDYDFDSAFHERSKRHFKEQLNLLRKDTALNGYSFGSHEANFKSYQLKSFIFDDQRRPPFVVEIINDKQQFVSFFSFTDEAFYSGNSIDRRDYVSKSPKEDSVLLKKINLEDNLNRLIEKLALNDKSEIFDFTKKLCSILNMVQIDQDSIQNEVSAICVQTELKDSIYSLVKEEQTIFFKKGKGDILMVRTQSGFGYWRFWMEEKGGEQMIRAAFFSDILYRPIYM